MLNYMAIDTHESTPSLSVPEARQSIDSSPEKDREQSEMITCFAHLPDSPPSLDQSHTAHAVPLHSR